MVDSYSLGKDSKFGNIDFSKLKSGITKKELGIEEGSVLASIFDSIDENQKGDSKGKLDRNELTKFIDKIKELIGDDNNLSLKEAKNFKINNVELGKNKKELLTFLNKLSSLTKNVKNLEVNEKSEVITFEDGHTEEIFPDGSKIITVTNGDKTIKTTKDNNDNVVSETEIEGENETTTEYKDKKAVKKIVTNTNTGIEEEYDLSQEPAKLIQKTNKKTGEVTTWENGKEKIVVKNGSQTKTTIKDDENNYTTIISDNNRKLSQTKVVDGKEYNVKYDGNGNTIIVVQANEKTITDIAQKFNCKPEDLLRLNASKVQGNYPNAHFDAGEEIAIPGEIEADSDLLKDRKNINDAKAEDAENRRIEEERIRKEQEAKAKAKAEAQRKAAEKKAKIKAENEAWGVKDRVNYKRPVDCHFGQGKNRKTYKGIYIGHSSKYEGRWVVKVGSKLYIMSQYDNSILKEDYARDPEKYKTAQKYNKNVKTRKNAESLANQFYKIADKNEGFASMEKMQALLDKNVNADNIVAFLDAYDREKTKNEDSSIIDTVTSEIGAGGSKQQRKVLMTILEKLCQAAKKAGVSDGDIAKAKKDFIDSLNKEFAAIRRTNPKDMEKAIDFLRGAIAAKQTSNVEKMDDKTAIDSFNSSFGEENASAQSAYNDAKGEDGWSWSARTGDTVCGWFGCNTIEEMEAKLGKNAKTVKELASAKTEAEFKAKYKQIFGIEFEPQKIAAADAASANYAMAQGLNQSIKIYNALLNKANSQNLTELENSIKSSLKIDNEQFNALKNEIYSNCKTDDDKKQAFLQYLQSAKQSLTTEYQKITNGKSIEQMGKDAQLVLKSAFGTNDIGKDVAQFTQNMATTEMVTDMAGDIALTVALSFVPGGAAWGAARMAATAAKWGNRGLKFAKIMKKTAVAFNKIKKFEQGTKWARQAEKGSKTAKALNTTAKVVTSTKNAVVGTAIYESTATNHTLDEIKEKCITNGIYGALGAGASELAPKLMQMFKISNSFATEIAEEIINAVGSLGVETAKGGEYGSTDAVIDIVSGILMARLSHVGGTKSNSSKTKSSTSTPESPRTETPRGNDQNLEPPKTDVSQVSDPIPEPPKTEAPKSATSIPEPPKTDASKVSDPNPKPPKTDAPKTNDAIPTKKSYSEMNENELFVEYQRLRQETTSTTLDNKTKVANINKMNEISRELESKGFKIENDELKSVKTKSPIVDDKAIQAGKADNSKYKSSHDTGLFGANNNIEQFDFSDIGKNEKLSDYIRNNLDKKFEVLSYSDDFIKVQGTAKNGKVYNFIISNQPNAKMPVLVEMFTPPSTKPEYVALNDLKKGAGTKISDGAYKSYDDKIALQNSHNNLSIENSIKNIQDKQLQDLAVSIRNKMLKSQQGELMSKFDDLTKKMTFLENASDELAYNKILENLQEINNKIGNPNYNKELSKLLDETIEYVDVVNTTKGRYTVQRERSTQNLDAYREKAIQDVLNHNKIAKHIGTDYTITAQTKDFVKVKVNENGCDVEYIFNTAGEPCVRKSTLPPLYKKEVYSTYDTGKNKWVSASEQEWNSLNDRMLHSKDHPNNTREWEDYGRNRLAQEEKDIAFDKQFENVKTRLMDPKLSKQEKIDFYKEYYLSKIHDDLKLSCDKLGFNVNEIENIMLDMINKYDMPLYLDKNIKPMDIISVKNELDAWYKASNGTAKFPTLLDLTHLDKNYYRSRYNGNTKTGYRHNGDNHISVDGSLPFDTTLRHELTHLNDMQPRPSGKFGKNNEIDLTNNKDFENGTWYREELERAGITNIDYAYTDKLEFIAVAAQGDMSKYSPEFKQVLVDLGMPEWMFKLDDVMVEHDLSTNTVIHEPKTNVDKNANKPKVDEPKADEPKADEPVTGTPKVDDDEIKVDNNEDTPIDANLNTKNADSSNSKVTPATRRFSSNDINNFAALRSNDISSLTKKLENLGFEREMISNLSDVLKYNGESFILFINKSTGTRYVFTVESSSITPRRMISTDINTGRNYHTVEVKFDADGNIITNEKQKPTGTKKESSSKVNESNTEPEAELEIEAEVVLDELDKEYLKYDKYFDNSKTKTENPIRNDIRQRIEKDFLADAENLRTTLGDADYAKLKWEDIIPQNATSDEIQNILRNLKEKAESFSKLDGVAKAYGKNFGWAEKVFTMQNNAAKLMQEGADFKDVINGLAKDYRNIDLSIKIDEKRMEQSGRYRPYYFPEGNATTPCMKGGEKYGMYYDRYKNMVDSNKKLPQPYPDAPMTRLVQDPENPNKVRMIHPEGKSVTVAMKHVEGLHNELKPLIKKVQSGKELSANDINLIQDRIAEIHYSLSHAMPWARGSNGIIDAYMRSIYKSLNFGTPTLKQNVSLDLEAFCTDLETFKNKWKNHEYFEPVAVDVEINGGHHKTGDAKVDGGEPRAKQYSEMNENELFAEYQRLHQETSSANIDNKTKATNINKMKEITKELEAKGYKIENGELKTNTPSSSTLSKHVGKEGNVADTPTHEPTTPTHTPTTPTQKPVVDSPSSSKFGTPEEPNTGAILNATTESEIREALDIVNKMPDNYAAKDMLKSNLEKKLNKINAEKAASSATQGSTSTTKSTSNANFNNVTDPNWEMRGGSSDCGYSRNRNAQTNVNNITQNDVYIGYDVSGAGYINGSIVNKHKGISTHFYNGLPHDIETYAVYNQQHNVTTIGVKALDDKGRSTLFNISVEGQVSEKDAQALLEYLESKNLLPKNNNGTYSVADYDNRTRTKLFEDIKEETANFFNKIGGNSSSPNLPHATQTDLIKLRTIDNNVDRFNNNDGTLRSLRSSMNDMPDSIEKQALLDKIDERLKALNAQKTVKTVSTGNIDNVVYSNYKDKIDALTNQTELKQLGFDIRNSVNDEATRNKLLQDLNNKLEEVWEMPKNDMGFVKNKNTVTTVKKLTKDDISYQGRQNGDRDFAAITHSKMPIKDFLGVRGPDLITYYSPSNNVTGIQLTLPLRRGSNFCLYIKGQVSEADAKRLMEHLRNTKLDPSNPKSPRLIPDHSENITPNEWEQIGNKVQEEVINFFNNL